MVSNHRTQPSPYYSKTASPKMNVYHYNDSYVQDSAPCPLEPMVDQTDEQARLFRAQERMAPKEINLKKAPRSSSPPMKKKAPPSRSSYQDQQWKSSPNLTKKAPGAYSNSEDESYDLVFRSPLKRSSYPQDSKQQQSYVPAVRKETFSDDGSTTSSYPSFYDASVAPSVHSRAALSVTSRGSTTNRSRAADQGLEVAIAPGVTAPLRGAQETTQAVRQDFITNVACWGCQQEVYCIADCRWAVCPGCRTISPLEDNGLTSRRQWGLGLGLTPQCLETMRYEELSRSSFF